jgi:hypothetical protein
MQVPNFEKLRRERADCEKTGRRAKCSSYAAGVHPNPRLFKYHWWVFWNESPVDGHEFISDRYHFCTAAAMELVASLKERNEPCWLYNSRLPRLGSTIPFDPKSKRWQGVTWAPAYDDDPDPMAGGELSGHK